MIKRICRAMIHPQHERPTARIPQLSPYLAIPREACQESRHPELSPATRSNTGAWDWAALRAPAMAYDFAFGGYFDDTAIPLRFSMYRVPE
ncbi:hypothetical protein CCUS01_03625 [Colletotrichum cuscutae]|uniref:Uncharacterized protein n=1 Tax=Colletotrichum cuscutae TaxID=1209917 RepID=A0AAI9VFA9_9PEZI|nr:hypothetical protein CCUS01_03625 [Colletotrichum cuscutae]